MDQTGGYDEISAEIIDPQTIAATVAEASRLGRRFTPPDRTKSTACCWRTEGETGMTKKIALKIEEMTAATFAPFGEVWAAGTCRPIGGSCERRILRVMATPAYRSFGSRAPCTFSEVERHFGVTKASCSCRVRPPVVCVASPSATDDPADSPRARKRAGVLINPGMGYAFKRGTWHSLNRFVIEGDEATFLIINSEPNPTHMIDYQTGAISVFRALGQ